MVTYLPRSAWGARPARGSTPMTASVVDGVALHWPGTTSSTPIRTEAQVASALRGWQDFHMDGRGWSDIAYQVAVDQEGRAWTLRGFANKSAANGNADLNNRYGAILLVLVQGEQPTAAMKATVRAVVADFRNRYPGGTILTTHQAIRPAGTDCPGPAAIAALSRGDFTPGTTPTQEDDMAMTDEQATALVAAAQETAQLFRTHAVRMDNLVNSQMPQLRAALATVVEHLYLIQVRTGVTQAADIGSVADSLQAVRQQLAEVGEDLDAMRDHQTPVPDAD